MQFTINGTAVEVEADIRTSLLDLMRNYLGFTGTKKGCDQGLAAPAPCWWTASVSIPVWPSRFNIRAAVLQLSKALQQMATFIPCKSLHRA